MLNRKRDINSSIKNRIVIDKKEKRNSPKYIREESDSRDTKISKPLISSFSVPKKPNNLKTSQVFTKYSDSGDKENSSAEKKKVIEDMISQGNTIFEVLTTAYPFR